MRSLMLLGDTRPARPTTRRPSRGWTRAAAPPPASRTRSTRTLPPMTLISAATAATAATGRRPSCDEAAPICRETRRPKDGKKRRSKAALGVRHELPASRLHETDRHEYLPGAGDILGELLPEGVAREVGVVPALQLEDVLPLLRLHHPVD